MSTSYERAVESLRLVSQEMEVASLPAGDLVMATVAVNAMRDEIATLRAAIAKFLTYDVRATNTTRAILLAALVASETPDE